MGMTCGDAERCPFCGRPRFGMPGWNWLSVLWGFLLGMMLGMGGNR
jgi:hypothetical protein